MELNLKKTVFIPDDNDFDIPSAWYDINEIVSLLRKHKNNPDAVQFIADMLEV